jgi:polyisoprenoid-binding protein YceI
MEVRSLFSTRRCIGRGLLFALVLAWTLSARVWAQDSLAVREVDIEFTIKNAGITVDGQLSGLEVQGQFRPKRIEKSRFSARIPVKSLQTGIGMRDRHLMKKEYFYQEAYPYIRFESSRIEPSREGPGYVLHGELSIRGITRKEAIRFTAEPTSRGWRLEGSTQINRLHYKVGEESWTLGDEVNVSISCLLKPNS